MVVDDNPEHLRAITKTFDQMGSPCLGLVFDPEQALDPQHFRGVRCLFLDLHLTGGQISTDNKAHFARIQTILEDNISATGGPFILVMWTEHPQHRDSLIEYLDKNLEKPYSRPLAVFSLAKDRFISLTQGAVTDQNALKDSIVDSLNSSPQLAALLGWETDVLAAAGDTLGSLLALVPNDRRKISDYSSELDTVLSRLAIEAVGKPNVTADPRTAVSSALAPILYDRILNQRVSEENDAKWKSAVSKASGDLDRPSDVEAGSVNRMLHLSLPPAEATRSTDWGCVVNWPYAWDDETLEEKLGMKIGTLLGGEFLIEKASRRDCKPVLIRIGAACDYAQAKVGPLTYLLAFEIPEGATRKLGKDGKPRKLTDAIWKSPVFMCPGSESASRLHVHIRFPITVLEGNAKHWTPRYRVREQLLMNLISVASSYSARPGIVQIFA